MLLRHDRYLFAGVLAMLMVVTAGAQEDPPDADGMEEANTYFDLRRSEDRTTRLTAERYFNLVKRQEWADATGKSKVMAKYVEHDPDMEWVKLEIVKGSSANRVVNEGTVPIAKLNRTCQSRVRQIATLQKKLDELLAAAAATSNDAAAGTALADPGAPMLDERGAEPGVAGREPQGEFGLPAEPGAPPAEFDPDPLGFAEMDLSSSQSLPGAEGGILPGVLPGQAGTSPAAGGAAPAEPGHQTSPEELDQPEAPRRR